MGKGFKRVSLSGSDELFRPTVPEAPEPAEAPARPRPPDKHLLTVHLTPGEVDLLLDAIQVAKYPERQRVKPSLDRHERLDALRDKIRGEG